MPLPPGKFSMLALREFSFSSYYSAKKYSPQRSTELPHYSSTNCFLEIGAACPEPAAVTELVAPARQDTDAQGPGQCTPKCNNSLLFSTLPCRDSTLNSEELAHPKIQKKSLFVRVNMGLCCRKQRCYTHAQDLEGAQSNCRSFTILDLQNLNTIHYCCSSYCTEQ